MAINTIDMKLLCIIAIIFTAQVLYAQGYKKDCQNSLADSIDQYGLKKLARWNFEQRDKNNPNMATFSYEINDSIAPSIGIFYNNRSNYPSFFRRKVLQDTIIYYLNGKLLETPIEEEISENHPYTLSDVKKLENFVVTNEIQAMYWSKTKIRFETEKFTLYYYYSPTDTLVLNEKNELRHIRDNWYFRNNKQF